MMKVNVEGKLNENTKAGFSFEFDNEIIGALVIGGVLVTTIVITEKICKNKNQTGLIGVLEKTLNFSTLKVISK